MSLILLRKLSLQKGHTYLSDPAEIDGAIDLKCAGWIDAEVGPFVKGAQPPKPPLFAIVRGLTPEGWDELERLDRHDDAPASNWDQLVSFTKSKLPHFKSRDGSNNASFRG
ncbi:MAG: hypothetical protein ABI410_18960 [Rhodoferax sp.]